jgi:hypothetical protein
VARAGRRAERHALMLRDPGPVSRYAAFAPPPSGSFGHGLERLRRLPVAGKGHLPSALLGGGLVQKPEREIDREPALKKAPLPL